MLFDALGNMIDTESGTLGNGVPCVRSVAHRGLSDQAPENTLPAFILAKKNGFNYVETDVAFTSDGVAVLLHDDTIDRTSDGSGAISSLTYEEVSQYDFGSWKANEYAGTKIPTFKEFIEMCKKIGLHPHIELKSGSYTQEQITGIVAAVEAAGMRNYVTYASFVSAFLEYVKQADESARLVLATHVIASDTIATAQGLKTGRNEVCISAQYTHLTAETMALVKDAEIPLEVWTLDNADTIVGIDAYISSVVSNSLNAAQVLHDAYID